MRELAKVTGHTKPYLRQQLRKFGIQPENAPIQLGPFGWDWKDGQLVENAKEQTILTEIQRLRAEGKGSKSIAAELNRRSIPSKIGTRWHPSSVRNVVRRMEQAESKNRKTRSN